MKFFWMIVFLVLIWCGFSNDFGIANIVFGATIAAVCSWVLRSRQRDHYTVNIWPLLILLGFTAIELVKSSVLVAWEVLTPKLNSQPKIIDVPLSCRNDIECTWLANLISLTPGTLSIDLSDDKLLLKVHVMFAQDPDEAIDFIKKKLEPKVMRVFEYA